ncbi:hypothetical protein A3A03_02855 [Candidatus Nomurabacteria bacterium RIFCSPLOWO2_01_FULL_40_18]|uniref:O-antigen ligase-related domain-containing protein n=1 Tax=Candidatus Nomurabacteria bacterium RIFCSPLOWO2_01_FULL_40_18 TaxID=1801773 RepID=A0A1F6XKE1_9BACT|nr:MAG: hypothetical protein A3A03_02855 [Candidatus Nomurabacteria bacterium RIFCSPLOWO2_01_FULL_40_18]
MWQFTLSRWAIYLTVFLAPLYFSTSHWYAFTTPKTLLIIAGTLIASVFFIWGLVKNKGEGIKITYLHYILFTFLLLMSISGFFGIDPYTSFFGTFFSSVGIVFLIVLGLLACLISEFVRRDFNFISSLLASAFISGVIVALISYLPVLGIKGYFFDLSQGGSTIGNTSFTGTFLLFAIGFGGYLTLISEKWKKKTLYILGILVILACPIFFNADFWRGAVSFSQILHHPLLASGEAQGAQLGVLVLILTTIFLWLSISRKKTVKIIGTIFFILFMISLSWGYTGLLDPTSKIHQHFMEIKGGVRFVFWDISERAVAERPLLGWGFENYQTVYQRHFDPIVFKDGYTDEQGVTNPHNVIYDMAVSSGILGLIAYLVLLGYVCMVFVNFARSQEKEKKYTVIFAGIILGYFVQNFFIFDTPTAYLVYFLCIGLAIGFLAVKNQTESVAIPAESFLKKKIIGWGTIGLLSALFVIFVILPAYESRQWQNLRETYLFDRIEMMKNVSAISLMGGIDDSARYANEVLRLVDDFRISPDASEEVRKMLEAIFSTMEILKNDKENLGNFYANYEAGMLLHLAFVIDPKHDLALLDEARIFLENARSISELNPRVYYNLAQNELFRQNTKEAVNLIKAGMAISLKDEGQAFLDRIKK